MEVDVVVDEVLAEETVEFAGAAFKRMRAEG